MKMISFVRKVAIVRSWRCFRSLARGDAIVRLFVREDDIVRSCVELLSFVREFVKLLSLFVYGDHFVC